MCCLGYSSPSHPWSSLGVGLKAPEQRAIIKTVIARRRGRKNRQRGGASRRGIHNPVIAMTAGGRVMTTTLHSWLRSWSRLYPSVPSVVKNIITAAGGLSAYWSAHAIASRARNDDKAGSQRRLGGLAFENQSGCQRRWRAERRLIVTQRFAGFYPFSSFNCKPSKSKSAYRRAAGRHGLQGGENRFDAVRNCLSQSRSIALFLALVGPEPHRLRE